MSSPEDPRQPAPAETRSGPPRAATPARRAALLCAVLIAVAIPAVVVRAGCTTGTCSSAPVTAQHVPFCSLPPAVRARIAGGFQDGRSPDVLTVAAGTEIAGSSSNAATDEAVPWLSLAGPDATRVPLAFLGPGISRATLGRGAALDAVAPTLARILGVRRPATSASGADLPTVRSNAVPRLMLVVAWEGIGSRDLPADRGRWPFLASALRTGAGTLFADTGSLPVDPAAVLTTIGTGALPSEHGITGTWLRSPYTSAMQRAGGSHGPPAELPTLAQDLVKARADARVAIVEPSPVDQGLVGAEYYTGLPLPKVRVAPLANVASAASGLLDRGFGTDATPDVLAVVLRGPVAALDRETRRLTALADRATGSRFVEVVAGTGSLHAAGRARVLPAAEVTDSLERRLPPAGKVVQAITAGGIFVRRNASTSGVTGRDLAEALLRLRAPRGGPLMADAFASFAVSLARYCQ
jgi:hypothetical protein